MSPLNDKIKAIKDWLPPNNINELKSFLGFIGYRNFINEYPRTFAPLCKLLRKRQKLIWTDN